jgi:hypothetical protein
MSKEFQSANAEAEIWLISSLGHWESGLLSSFGLRHSSFSIKATPLQAALPGFPTPLIIESAGSRQAVSSGNFEQ